MVLIALGFATPMRVTVGMNVCVGLYPAIVAVFVARIFNIDVNI